MFREFLVFGGLEHGRREGAQVIEEILLQTLAVKRRQTDDERLGEILTHPLFQLQPVAAVSRKAFGVRRIVFVLAAAVGVYGDAGDQHHLFGGNLLQIFPGCCHHGQVGRRVRIGQEHGRRHPRIDAQIGAGAVLRRHILAVADRRKPVAGHQVATHKAGGPHQKIAVHTLRPISTYSYRMHYNRLPHKKQRPAL